MPGGPQIHTIESDLLVAGGGVGCLVAAIAAADAGREVTLLLPPRGVGAGFAALARSGYRLDLGCRRFDLTRQGDASPLDAYSPGAPIRPFADHIRAFLEQRIGLRLKPAPPPQMSFGGIMAPDFAASLDLTSLPRMLSAADLAAVEGETHALMSASPANPLTLGMDTPPDLASAPLESASLANHGKTFHARLIAPFADKLYPDQWRQIPADLAGKIWTPLLYPRTINGGCRGEIDRGRGAVTYFYPAGGYFGELVEKLLETAAATPGLSIIHAPDMVSLARDGAYTTATHADGSVLRWQCPFVMGTSVEAWCALAGVDAAIEKLPLAIIWLEVKDEDLLLEPGLIHVFDPQTSAYRISFGGSGARPGQHIVTVEMTGGSAECSAGAAGAALARLGILRSGARVTQIACEPALPIVAPSARNRAALRAAHTRMAARGIEPVLTGTLNDLKADSLNDHILQGLTAYL